MAPASLFALVFRPELRVGKAVTEFSSIVAMRLMEDNKGQMVMPKCHIPEGQICLTRQQGWRGSQRG